MMTKKKCLEHVARLSGTVITLVLLTFVVLFATFIVAEFWLLYKHTKQTLSKLPDSPEWRIHNARKLFLPDGTLHLVKGVDTQHNDDSTIVKEITDINGNILWQGIRQDRPFKYLDWGASPQEFAEFYGEKQTGYINRWLLSPQLPEVLDVPVRVAGEIKEVWRYDFEAEVFAGYELGSGLMGYLGADGFAGSKAQAQPLGQFKGFAAWTDENPSAVVMLWQTKHRIYQIDFRTRKGEIIFDSAQSDIESIRWHQWRPMNPKDRDDSDIRYRPLIDCQTADHKHHLIMREPNQILTVEIPEQWGDNVDFTATSDAVFLEYHDKHFNPPASLKLMEDYRREYDSKSQPQSLQLYKIAEDGKLEFVSRFDWIKPAAEKSNTLAPEEIPLKCIRRTSPPVFDLLMTLFGDDLYNLRNRAKGLGMMTAYAAIITDLRPHYSPFNYVLSAAMVVIALWHGWARRTSWGRMLCWLAVVALFGIAGLLTYLALNHTPVIKCPICGKKRGLERFNCIRCGSTLPIPQRKPTDLIFST